MLNRRFLVIILALTALFAGGCATMPAGPSVMVLPAPGKSFEQFQVEDNMCRRWAAQLIGLSPQEAANQSTATGAVVGTAVGAGLGAAIGSTSGNAGAGAAIGAVSGLIVGSASGANAGEVYGWRAQRRYDIAYMQCMYAKGNDVPGVMDRRGPGRTPPPPPDLRYAPQGYTPSYSTPPMR